MVSVPLWAYKKSELINSSDFILSSLAPLTGHELFNKGIALQITTRIYRML